MEPDVIIVGGGPAGLMLAAELRLGGVRPLVLERNPQLGHTPNANGLGGQIIELLRYRGLFEKFASVAVDADPTPIYPFGGVHVDLTGLTDPPLTGIKLEHPSVDRVLELDAIELGADIRYGHRVVGVQQDDDGVTAEVEGPDGPVRLRARFLVGCDGAYSRIRDMAGIAFPGVTYPEVNRLAEVAVHGSVTVLENGDLEVRDEGAAADGGAAASGDATPDGPTTTRRVAAGFTRTEHGVFAMGSMSPGTLMVQTIEDGPAEPVPWREEPPATMEDLGESIRRVLGHDVPLGEPRRLSRYQHSARQAKHYRAGRILLAGDAAHVLPATGIARSVGMLDAVHLAWRLAAEIHGWAPDGLLDGYHDERHLAGGRALLQTRAQVALRRGHDEAADALRAVFQELLQDEQPQRRLAALISGADVRYPEPTGVVGGAGGRTAPGGAGHAVGPDDDRHPLAGRFVPDLPLRTDAGPTSVGAYLQTARPVLLVLADRPELLEVAEPWRERVDLRRADTDERPADALLIRPDAHVAWATDVDAPADVAGPALIRALERWFGRP
ncbi:FAD-dependent monooxygenase [Patulibacter minatonensis]|uniref:FAD-dependent monooxygenase n=1 Tax=Patulibacter minatonensis TaxID=298163 RepID=UPI00047D73AD|nr:FAD-dependent monooxygenase [Patulibacter minatonensis]